MTDEDREAVYDEEIAPLLMQAAKLCEQHGLPIVAVVWYSDIGHGRTTVCPDGAPPGSMPGFTLVNAAAQCEGNLDRLVIGLSRSVPKDRNNSAVLAMLRGRTPP